MRLQATGFRYDQGLGRRRRFGDPLNPMEHALNRFLTTPKLACGGAWLLAALLIGGAVQAQSGSAVNAQVLVSGPAGQITRGELEIMVNDRVPLAERARFWTSSDSVTRMARSLYTQRALAAEAQKEGLDRTPEGADYLRLVRERALTELLMQQKVHAATPDAAALEQFARSEYKAKPERFALPEEVHVRHILLSVARDGSDDARVKAEAQKLVDELRHGADFAALARTRSADRRSAERGGDLGFFPRGKMAPEFEAAAFALKRPGDISDPIKSGFGYHVIELVGRKPPQAESFEQVLPQLREELLAKIDGQQRRHAWEQAGATAQVDSVAVEALIADKAKH